MKDILKQKLFPLILLNLLSIPCVGLALSFPDEEIMPQTITPHLYPAFDWLTIIIFSFLVFLIGFLAWAISPLGIIFILASLAQFLVSKKAVQITAWIFQGLVFVFTFLLGIIGIFYTLSLYGEEKYIFLFGLVGATIVIFCLMIGTIIAQIVWQIKKRKSNFEENKISNF